MAYSSIPMIALPRVGCMFIRVYRIYTCIYIYIYIYNVVEEAASFWGTWSINGHGT